MKKEEVETNDPELVASIRDLIVHLHRGNNGPAEALVNQVSKELTMMMQSGRDPSSLAMLRAQQTMFAIDEVRMLMAQRDLNGALEAARDAGKEWGKKPKTQKETAD